MRAAPGHQSACGPKPPQSHTSFSPGTARPLRAARRRRSRQNQEREKRSHLFCRGFVFRVYARLNIFLLIQPPHCRAYTLHIFIVGKESTNLITSLYIEFFPSVCRMGILFAQNKRIFSHHAAYRLNHFLPIPGRNPEPIPNYGSRGERRFSGV